MWKARTLLQSVWDLSQRSSHDVVRDGSIVRSVRCARRHIARFSSAHVACEEVRAASEASLQQIFDDPSYWKDFVQKVPVSKTNHGLIGNPYLTSARGFKPLAEKTQQGCQRIVEQVVAARTQDEYRQIPRQLDLLSDALCRVLDLAEFIRLSHPDPAFQQAAVNAYAVLWEYMNVLNTTPELKSQLEHALNDPDIASRWSNEEKCVADILLKDFSKSAIDLPDNDRQRFIKLSNDVKILGSNFLHNTRPASSAVRLPQAQLKGLNRAIREDLPTKNDGSGTAYLPLAADLPYTALSQLQDEDARKTVYISSKCVQKSQLNTLARLLTTRQELAQMSDFGSHAEMNLTDKMAKTPDAVHSFLLALTKDNKPYVNDEIETLRQAKSADTGGGAATELQVWDTAYYQDHLNQAEAPPKSKFSWLWSQPNESLRDYFSLGRVMQGLSRLFERLYGVRFVPRPPVPSELWDRQVRRLDVLDQHDRHIAVLYCDLFSRAGKSPNPAHFTLRCSRRITPEERSILYPDLGMTDVEKERDASGQGGNGGTGGSSRQASTSGVIAASDTAPPERLEAIGRDETTVLDGVGVDDVYQLPVIALVCDFPNPPQPSAGSYSEEPPTLLSLREVQTLFHEMGHAIHSILARTSLQVISGTRCATDFAEIPSVLMESFAVDHAVLNLFAQHWSTGMPLLRSRDSADNDTIDTNTPGAKMLEEALRYQRNGHGLATETQVLYSLLDQAYHHPQRYSEDAAAPTTISVDDTTRLFYAVYGQYASIAEPPGLSPQGLFGHLVEYGGTYYSYLFDRAVAGKIWRDVFHSGSSGSTKINNHHGSSGRDDGNGALDRAAGMKFKREMLRWGGARDPWECLASVLRLDDSGGGSSDYEKLRKGGQEAMEEVGRWGVHVD